MNPVLLIGGGWPIAPGAMSVVVHSDAPGPLRQWGVQANPGRPVTRQGATAGTAALTLVAGRHTHPRSRIKGSTHLPRPGFSTCLAEKRWPIMCQTVNVKSSITLLAR